MFLYEDGRYRDQEMVLTGIAYRGHSVGWEETVHGLPGLDIGFDLGRATLGSTPIPVWFISHQHADHWAGILKHADRRRAWGMPPARYYLPHWMLPGVKDAIREFQIASGQREEALDIHPIREGGKVDIGNDMWVEPFLGVHRCRSFGYTVYTKRKRLKPEYVGLTGADYKKLKQEGIVLDEIVTVPEVCYTGDSSVDVFRAHPDALRARLLITECTFVNNTVNQKETLRAGHIHLDDICVLAKAGAFKNGTILLGHFSARDTSRYLHETVNRRLSGFDIAPKVHLLVPVGKEQS